MKILGVIPARYASARFPGKPLADINGKPMIQCVYEQAVMCKELSEVLVATDDKRIETAVKKFKGNVVMTSAKHESGTDRCYEALQNLFPLKKGGKRVVGFDAVINIQGDEPFIQPQQISKVANCFKDGSVDLATLVMKMTSIHELANHNTVKVVVSKNKQALYFSRTAIPYYRGEDFSEWIKLHTYYKHVGIYGYRTDVLAEITKLERSSLEMAESLEQLRWLENGYKIAVEFTDKESYAIDTPEDIKNIVKKFIK
ncbi:MAG: 3-deoxy-manno-octulosonate cytidylyltransferase [Bacteroidetes bacterium]|nr:MAG: 3-deoxy-manno-octulosonate cytidylyltransferase [Bacteroidota bacterium]